MSRPSAPFRWDMANPRLGRRLGRGRSAEAPPGFKEDVLRVALDVLHAGEGADLVFLGRSPESVYDLLCGLLADSSWRGRVQQLQLSAWNVTPGRLRRERIGALEGLWSYADSLGLTPERILARERPVAFVDVVFSGRTVGNLLKVLRCWTGGPSARWRRVRERLRLLALVERDHVWYSSWSPSHSSWTESFQPHQLRRIELASPLWRYLADEQPKTTGSYVPDLWGRDEAARPPQEPERLEAARLGRALYRFGVWSRARVATELERKGRPAPGLADLIRELRVEAAPT